MRTTQKTGKDSEEKKKEMKLIVTDISKPQVNKSKIVIKFVRDGKSNNLIKTI